MPKRGMCANERCDDFVCYTGFDKTEDDCVDIDECENSKCPDNSNCANTEVKFAPNFQISLP